MYTFYGFLKYPPLTDNAPDIINPLGELSDNSNTYTKDKSIHSNTSYPQTILVGFQSQQDAEDVEVPTGIPNRLLQLSQWLYVRAQAGNITTNPSALVGMIQAEFGDQLIELSIGPLVTHAGIRLPAWIEYVDTKTDVGDNRIKVWLSDSHFSNEYPGYIIEVIPPLDNIDDLFRDESEVKALLDEVTLPERFQDVAEKRGQYPYTMVRVMTYEWINSVDETRRIPTPWIVIIYGQAGNNPDLIKEAIIDYIMENTERPREDWEDLIPDLLLSTEFIITPFWNRYAVPNLELAAGIYSPTVRPAEATALTLRTVKGNGYSDDWIRNQLEYGSLIFRSVAYSVVGNPNNRTGITQFSEQFSDLILVTNVSTDFNRMSVRTQEFKVLFNELVKLAETTTPTTQVPQGRSRLTRGGVVYVGAHYENILYLVVTKYSVDDAAPTEMN